MPERTSYQPGTLCWVDLNAPDPDAATTFYTGLFGWQAHLDGEVVAGHVTLTLDGDLSRPVAALMPMIAGAPPGTPPFWTTYVGVTDVDATARAAQDAGGRIFMGPMDTGDLGRFAILTDPYGAAIGLWQAAKFLGAGVAGEPGTYCWSELATRDPEGAKAFYGKVFGWGSDTHEGGTHTEWRNAGGPAIGWMTRMTDQWPAEMPSRWSVHFAVADCDATAAHAVELGGTVTVAPADVPAGRRAVLADPGGGRFAVIRQSP